MTCGFRRPPVVTAVVFVVTATTSVLGLVVPGVLAAWQRTPQGLHGELAGALTVALALEARVPWLAAVALAYWCAALLGARWGPGPLLVGVAGGVVVQAAVGRGLAVRRPVAVAAAIVALVLLAARDLHGAAMVAGIAIAALIGRQGARARP